MEQSNRERKLQNFLHRPTRRQRREHRRIANTKAQKAFWTPITNDLRRKRLGIE